MPAFISQAQVYTIADGDITTCAGSVYDSGGQGGPGYQDNEFHAMTICPSAAGQGIVLDFQFFDLSVAGASIDHLDIYDGPNNASPLIGIYTGVMLLGQTITVTPTNVSGCITLEFTSNDQGIGNFAASISCLPNCYPPIPTPQVVGEQSPALVCGNAAITFDGTASSSPTGQPITTYNWDFGDGTTGTGAMPVHSFPDAGEYLVTLSVTDAAGCPSGTPVELPVWVGTTPTFTGTTESITVCEGGLVELFGTFTYPTWTGAPVVQFGNPIPLPDDVNVPFSNSVEMAGFEPGAVIGSANDIVAVCVDIEHSYLGDIRLELECPNGQVVVLKAYPGGGGTFLGDANDTEPPGTIAVPGTCWTYCFSPTAILGTMTDCSQFGPTPNVVPVSQGTALAAGTYTPSQSFAALAGCPINGDWTITFTDNLNIDNGVICGWSVEFDAPFYTDITTFMPTSGVHPDSMVWSGPGVTADPAAPDQLIFTPNDPGTYGYDFSITDNFGCTYDTTITVTVTNAPEVEATAILGTTCSEPTQLHAEIVAYPPPPPDCEWTLVMHDSFGDGWNGGASLTILINGVPTNYVMPPGGNTTNVTISIPFGCSIQLQWTAGTIWNNENSFELLDYAGGTVYDSPQGPASGSLWQGQGSCGANVGPVTWQWTPSAGVDLPNAPDATTQITQPTEFVVQVYPFGQPWCFTTDTILVTPPSFLENDSLVVDALCNGDDGSITLITTGLGGPWNYTWVDGSGTSVQTTNTSDGDVLTIGAGTYTAFISEGPAGNGCLDTLVATITEPPLLQWATTPVDTLICLTGLADLAASAQGGTGAITLQWDQGLTGNGPHVVSPADTTLYTVVAVDANGCSTQPVSATVFVRPPLSITPLEPDTECFGLPVLMTAFGAAGGDGAYSYDWGAGPQLDSSYTFLLPVSNTVCVTLQDGCETPPVTSCAWLEILQTPPISISADTTWGCAPFAVRFILQDTTLLAQVQWSYGDGVVANEMDSVVHTYANAGNYDLGAVITWPNGCVTDTLIDDMVRVISVPIADMSWYPHPPTINEPIVQFTDLSLPNVVSWWWDFGEDFGTSTEQDPVIEYPDDVGGNYPVMLVVANELGCTDTLRSVVEVHDEFMVWVPNAFTPDGNEHNQFFFVSGNDLSPEEFELLVFDRWGHVVHSSTDLYEKWDGTSGGTALPQGVYVWKLEIHSLSTREKREIMGHVNLLR